METRKTCQDISEMKNREQREARLGKWDNIFLHFSGDILSALTFCFNGLFGFKNWKAYILNTDPILKYQKRLTKLRF